MEDGKHYHSTAVPQLLYSTVHIQYSTVVDDNMTNFTRPGRVKLTVLSTR